MPLAASIARLEVRISPALHAILKRAEELQGRTMTDFVVSAVQEAAQCANELGEIRLSLATWRTLPRPSCPRQTCRHPWSAPSRFGESASDRPAGYHGQGVAALPARSSGTHGAPGSGLGFRSQGLGGGLLADALDRVARGLWLPLRRHQQRDVPLTPAGANPRPWLCGDLGSSRIRSRPESTRQTQDHLRPPTPLPIALRVPKLS